MDGAKKIVLKDFAKAYNELVQTNFYDNSMVSKADIERAKRASEPKPTLEEVAARLWASHDKHLERIEELRKVVEEERFHKGGNLDGLDEECKFHPEIYSRVADEQFRTPEEFRLAQMEFLANKNRKHDEMVKNADKTAVTMFKASEASNKLLEGKVREGVVERLNKRKPYSPKRNTDEVSVGLVAPEDQPIANIQMHRGAPISVALYEMNKN